MPGIHVSLSALAIFILRMSHALMILWCVTSDIEEKRLLQGRACS